MAPETLARRFATRQSRTLETSAITWPGPRPSSSFPGRGRAGPRQEGGTAHGITDAPTLTPACLPVPETGPQSVAGLTTGLRARVARWRARGRPKARLRPRGHEADRGSKRARATPGPKRRPQAGGGASEIVARASPSRRSSRGPSCRTGADPAGASGGRQAGTRRRGAHHPTLDFTGTERLPSAHGNAPHNFRGT